MYENKKYSEISGLNIRILTISTIIESTLERSEIFLIKQYFRFCFFDLIEQKKTQKK